MAFYRTVTAMAARGGHIQVVAATWEEPERNRRYLESHSVNVEHVFQGEDLGIMQSATPTLILVGKDDRVLRSWVGELPQSAERDVERLVQ
jgi:hypothetical protein